MISLCGVNFLLKFQKQNQIKQTSLEIMKAQYIQKTSRKHVQHTISHWCEKFDKLEEQYYPALTSRLPLFSRSRINSTVYQRYSQLICREQRSARFCRPNNNVGNLYIRDKGPQAFPSNSEEILFFGNSITVTSESKYVPNIFARSQGLQLFVASLSFRYHPRPFRQGS